MSVCCGDVVDGAQQNLPNYLIADCRIPCTLGTMLRGTKLTCNTLGLLDVGNIESLVDRSKDNCAAEVGDGSLTATVVPSAGTALAVLSCTSADTHR